MLFQTMSFLKFFAISSISLAPKFLALIWWNFPNIQDWKMAPDIIALHHVEGIFRKSGTLIQVEDLKSRFDQGKYNEMCLPTVQISIIIVGIVIWDSLSL